METARIITATILNSTVSGEIIFSTEVLPSSKPTRIMSMETIKPDMYSKRPCPKG